MQPDQENSFSNEHAAPKRAPSPASKPPVINHSAPSLAAINSALPAPQPGEPHPLRRGLAIVLSVFLALFLADAILCAADDSLIVFFNSSVLAALRGIVAPLTLLLSIPIYMLMGLTPMVPKRLFLPITLFHPAAGLAALPCLIHAPGRAQQVVWIISFLQLILSLGILYQAQGRFRLRWPIVAESQVAAPGFRWRNLGLFILENIFVLAPVAAIYLFFCARLAVDHFSDGFMALHPNGLTVQARKYVRNDGRVIQLIPMAHVGEADFYRKLTQSFSTNAIVLMEGVSDESYLLTNRITYRRMAASLGVAEQQKEFTPSRTQMVRADVDVEQFATNTIDFLNLVTLVHTKGLNAETLTKLMQYSEPGDLKDELFDDLLRKRNRHLLAEIQARLAQPEEIIVPWGAAHMPGIAKGIQELGFHVHETREYTAIRFGHRKRPMR